MERLYQPDFNCIFGPNYANAFAYEQVDSLVWPILNDIAPSPSLERLLQYKNREGSSYFYHRKLDLVDLKTELNCSGIEKAVVQAMDLGRDYGIENSDVINVVKLDPTLFSGVISFNLKENDIISKINKIKQEIPIVGIVIYPSYSKLDLNDLNNNEFLLLLEYCKNNQLFLKIDLGNGYFPDNASEFTSKQKMQNFVSNHQDLPIVLSGLDISGDFSSYYQLLKYYNNLWLEIEPRSFGGMTPRDCFLKLFALKGFVQNCWHRIMCGSATPTLESSQMMRGFLEATQELPFAQKCLLRTWMFRNIVRLNLEVFNQKQDKQLLNPLVSCDLKTSYENDTELNLIYDVHLRSYAITQLIFISNIIKNLFTDVKLRFPSLKNGELFIRSYHTTTSLIVNEHEYGNYLDLHYKFAEISKNDSSRYLHTVRALENRADFNHYDHELASTYGSRNLTIPIINGNLELGSRENFYVLVTFGPRSFHLLVKIKILKGTQVLRVSS